MHTQIEELDDLTKVSALKKKEEQKMHDVLLLLENLSCREEASIKLIIDCLYDIGYVNLINQKFRSRTLNGSLRLIARASKPAFKVIAWKWYKSNCPKLIANWLRTQVAFEPVTTVKQAAEIEAGLKPEPSKHPHSTSLIQLQSQNSEVKYLRSQVRMLASIVAGLIVVFGGSAVWFGYSLERSNLQNVKQLQNRIRVLETNTNEPFATGKDN
ncbi:MAG: hypothetical protein WBA07_11255 [Rivularia sp. (in: cyanobacteria)]